MSAYTQNYEYRFGRQKEDSKNNVISKEKLQQACDSAKKYLNHPEHEIEKRADKR